MDVLAGNFQIAVGASEQVDAHSDCTDVKIFMLDHVVGLKDLMNVYHNLPPDQILCILSKMSSL